MDGLIKNNKLDLVNFFIFLVDLFFNPRILQQVAKEVGQLRIFFNSFNFNEFYDITYTFDIWIWTIFRF